jgi:hypothetical protein
MEYEVSSSVVYIQLLIPLNGFIQRNLEVFSVKLILFRFQRIFISFYIILSVLLLLVTLGRIGIWKLEADVERRHLEFMTRNLDLEMIQQLDRDGDGVDKFEFISGVLIQLGYLRESDIAPWIQV